MMVMNVNTWREKLAAIRGEHRFIKLLAGHFVSSFGDQFSRLAIAVFVADRTGSALRFGLVLTLSMAPSLFASLVGGWLGDRYSRIHLSVCIDIFRVFLTLGLGLLVFSDQLQIWHLYVSSVVFGLARAVYGPTRMGMIPELVQKDHLIAANSTLATVTHITQIFGPGLAGLVVGLFGYGLAFLIDAVTFGLAAVATLWAFAGASPEVRSDSSRRSLWADTVQGYLYLKSQRRLFRMILWSSAMSIAIAPLYAVTPQFAQTMFGEESATALGLLWAVFSGGFILGAGLLQVAPARWDRLRLFYLAHLPVVLGFTLLPVARWIWVTAVLFGIVGVTQAVAEILYVSTVQSQAKNEMRSRVFAMANMLGMSTAPVSLLLAGYTADWLGPINAFLAGAVIMLASVVGAMLHDRDARRSTSSTVENLS